MKVLQATGEAFSPQKRTSNTKLKISSLFSFLLVIFSFLDSVQPTKIEYWIIFCTLPFSLGTVLDLELLTEKRLSAASHHGESILKPSGKMFLLIQCCGSVPYFRTGIGFHCVSVSGSRVLVTKNCKTLQMAKKYNFFHQKLLFRFLASGIFH